MAIQRVTDGVRLVQSAGTHYVGSGNDQSYFLVPELMERGRDIIISDSGGSNRIVLPAGLEVVRSIVAADEMLLTLSNGASVNIRGASQFTYSLAESLTPVRPGLEVAYADFAREALGVSTLPARGAVDGGGAVVNADGSLTVSAPPAPVDDHGDAIATASSWPGEALHASIETPGDRDMFAVTLSEGRDYTFFQTDASGGALDPYLRLYDAAGTLLALDDDSGSGLSARIDYSPQQSGTFYLEAGSYEDWTAGNYRLSMQDSAAAPNTPGFDYALNYTNAGDLGGYFNVIDQSIRAALDYWGQHLRTDPDALIDIDINYTPRPGNLLASAGALRIDQGETFNEVPVLTSAVQHALSTGEDLLLGAPDALINIASEDLSSNNWWYDPTPMDRQDNMPGANQLDFVGVMLHEFGHALGFNTTYDYSYYGLEHDGDAFTRLDTWMEHGASRGEFVFNGPQARLAYETLGGQGGVPLYVEPNQPGSSFSHYDGVSGNAVLEGLLMNPRVAAGERMDIGVLDLAMLEDIDYDTVDLPAANALTGAADGTEAVPALVGQEASSMQNWWI